MSGSNSNGVNTDTNSPLTYDQVADMRVRDLKRRLARTHGYAAEELAKMILKKELVEALAFEEEKVRLRLQADGQRLAFWRSVVVAIVVVLLVACWPLLQQGYEVAVVNFVVYTDRKKLEARRCWELQTKWGMLGVTLMFVIDLLQAWLTLSILLSWILPRSKYMFPTPNIPIRPAQFLGGPMEKAFGGYGINVGAMVVTWALRFTHGQLETWTGRALSAAMRAQKEKRKAKKKAASSSGNDDNDRAPQAQPSRRQARRQARQQAVPVPPPNLPPNWMEPKNEDNNESPAFPTTSPSHEAFMQQLETETSSGLDELD